MNVEGRQPWIAFDPLIFISIDFFFTLTCIFLLKRMSGLEKESKVHMEAKFLVCPELKAQCEVYKREKSYSKILENTTTAIYSIVDKSIQNITTKHSTRKGEILMVDDQL